MNNTADTFVPWGLHPVKPWVVSELKSRATEYGMNSTLLDKDKKPGTRTAWGRLFSNGIPTNSTGDKFVLSRDGFLMFGVNGFNESYGFGTDQVIGLDANGNKHTLPNLEVNAGRKSFPHRPPPCVTSIEVDLMGGQNASFSGLCRKAVVKWKCFSLDQLDYLTPYFLSPRVTCCVEWGWSDYNPASLVDYTNLEEMRGLFMDAQKVMQKISLSNGKYDLIMGYVIDFDYSMGEDGSYECSTTIASVSWLFDGIDYSNQTLKRKTSTGWEKIQDFSEFNRYCGWDSNAAQIADSDFPKLDGRLFSSQDNESTDYSVKKWVRFDYVVEVMNYYFSCIIGKSSDYSVDTDKGNTKFVWNRV